MADMILFGTGDHSVLHILWLLIFYAGMGTSFAFIWLSLLLFVYFLYMENGITGKYGPHPTVGAGEHCYYLYCRCGHYGSPLYHGVYGSGSQ